MNERVGPRPLRTNFWSPNAATPALEIKKRLWRERGYLVVDVNDPSLNISWVDRDYIKAVGDKLYGPRMREEKVR